MWGSHAGLVSAADELDASLDLNLTGESNRAAVSTRPNARTMTLSIPGPRGQILDRNGKSLAQNKVVWYPALMFPHFNNPTRDFVIEWGQERVKKANEVFGLEWMVKDEDLWQHYRHRRWLAMPITHVVTADRKKELEPQLIDGLILHPIYQRYYPQGDLAAHLIGYVGSKGKLEKGPINYGDPIFEFTEGRSGFEKIYDRELTGQNGLLHLEYDSAGNEVLREEKRAPRQGGSVVTTLDLDWQIRAEEVLAEHAHKGALVILDVTNGEIVAMASRPSYDLNSFVPFITTKDYSDLRENPDAPLFARSYQAEYPPASTFKAVVALAALQTGAIDRWSQIDTPAFVKLGKHEMWNWNKKPEGSMGVVKALYRSNNPFFIKVGISTRSQNILNTARALGYGQKTGLPLVGEKKGLLPSDEYMLKYHKRRMTDGDTANLSIGQGVILATPLQVAQGMAVIANSGRMSKLQLVRQVQDSNGRIVSYNRPEPHMVNTIDPESVSLVQEGLMRVVNGGGGTGWRAKLSYTVVCGKTGTAQWGPEEKEQKLGWFAGFFPLDRPKYAFAMVYEGRPGEKVGGGSKAAPMVKSFFEPIKDEVEQTLNPAVRALIVVEEETAVADDSVAIGVPGRATVVDEESDEAFYVPRALLVEEDPQPYIPGNSPVAPARAVPVVEEVEEPDFGEAPPRARIVEPEQRQSYQGEPPRIDDSEPPPLRALIIEE